MGTLNIDIVIVTFNRLAKLQYALECYDKQTMPFRTLIVVDNNSTDGTREFLETWKLERSAYDKHVIYLPENVGGSGGFYAGEKYALTLNPDWIYISDDDAYPDSDVMQRFYDFQAQHCDEKISVIGTSVVYMDRSVIHEHRGHISIEDNQFIQRNATDDEYMQSHFECSCISYVGVFLSAAALNEVGLVNKDFFIYQDDVEHSLRLAKYGKLYCVPPMIVRHDTIQLSQNMSGLDTVLWKEYYYHRNNAYMIMTHYPKLRKKMLLAKLDDIRSHRAATMSPAEKMKLEGIYDAIRGRLRIHPVYRPGFVPSKEINQPLPYPRLLWEFLYWMLRLRRRFFI